MSGTVHDYVKLMSGLASIPEVLPALLREIADGGLPDGSSVGVRHEDDGTHISIYLPHA